MGPEGPAATVAVKLIPSEAQATSTDIEAASTLTDRNGQFTVLGVPPGQYVLRITKVPRPDPLSSSNMTIVSSGGGMVMGMSDPSAGPPPIPTDPTLWAAQPLAVGRADVTSLTISLRTGLRVTGRVDFEGAKERPTAQMLGRLPVMIDPIEGRPSGPGPNYTGRIDAATSQFTTYGLPGGRYFVRVPGAPTGWTFKSAVYQGRDVSDVPLDLDSADATGVVITFTDQPTELSGIAQGVRGGDPDATVIVFPSDNTTWLNTGLNPRRIRSTRTGPNGSYKLTGLPAGSYYVAAIPDESSGDWQDPKFLDMLTRSASQLTLDDGEKKTQNVRTTQVR
jgi:hypothetical protein